MKLRFSWSNPTHVLLQTALIRVDLHDGVGPRQLAVANGKASIDLGSADIPNLTVEIGFFAGFGPPTRPVLAIGQQFAVTASPPSVTDVSYGIPGTPPTPVIVVPGRNPLLQSAVSAGSWHIVVDTRVVDVTDVNRAPLFSFLDVMVNPANDSRTRVLAHTDGSVPAFWIACAPRTARQTPACDVLCFFTPPQTSPAADVVAQLQGRIGELAQRLGVFLGQGLDVLPVPLPSPAHHFHRLHDHITPGSGDFVIARGWEQALADSPKHGVMVLPVPAGGTHNRAGTADLPSLLTRVHAVLHSHGLIAPPTGVRVAPPRFALAAHSLGAEALLDAVAARPNAYFELFLFDPAGIQKRLAVIAGTSARATFVGFSRATSVLPFHQLSANPAIAARLRLLPTGHAGNRPDQTAFADIVAKSPSTAPEQNPRSLGHGISKLTPVPFNPPTQPVDARFELLHQYAVWGGDDMGGLGVESHFLTQALNGSSIA